MRTFSPGLQEEMYGQDSEARLITLLTITHAALAEPIYLSSANLVRISDDPLQYATVSRGTQYLFFPFALVAPDDVDERAPVAQIMLENVSRKLVEVIRSVVGIASVTMEIVSAETPDTVEISWPDFQMKTAPYNADMVTISLGIDALTDTPYPGPKFTPGYFPGMY